MDKLYETITIRQPLTGSLNDLAQFILWLEKNGKITRTEELSNDKLVEAVRDFWELMHGED